jgi:hypothetical protein
MKAVLKRHFSTIEALLKAKLAKAQRAKTKCIKSLS